MAIHPTAFIAPDTKLGKDVEIGPYCIVESGCELGDFCRLASHVVIKSGTSLGKNNHVSEYVVLGGNPQHAKCPERVGRLEIGDENTFREHATVHRALQVDQVTRLGNGCLLMVNSHIGHDCQIGNEVILANNVMLAGHVRVDDGAFLSGAVAVHQFCRIGAFSMVGGQSHITKDVPPFVTVDGQTSKIVGLNVIGLKRRGATKKEIQQLKQVYRLVFRSGLRWSEMLDALDEEFATCERAARLSQFMRASKRGCVSERATPRQATIKLFPTSQSETPTRRAA